MTIDDLIEDFNRAACVSVFNQTRYDLYLENGGVFTGSYIPANVCIGQIHGDPMYIWDIDHREFIIISDDFVLDVSKMSPRPILTWIREDNQTYHEANCSIEVRQCELTCQTEIYLYSQKMIYPGDELVYKIIGRFY
jgi:hypothetical protein